MPNTIAIIMSIAAVAFLAALFISEVVHGNPEHQGSNRR